MSKAIRPRNTELGNCILEEWENFKGDAQEIAKKYDVTAGNVYYHLRTLCRKKGIPYEKLLLHPQKPHLNYKRREIMLYLNEKRLSLKQIREYIKRGWTVSDFAEHFSSTEDEFFESLRKITTSSFDSYKRDMDKNEKKKKKGETKMNSEIQHEENNEVFDSETMLEKNGNPNSKAEVIRLKITSAKEEFEKENELYDELQCSYEHIQAALKEREAELLKYVEEVKKVQSAITHLKESAEDTQKKMNAALDKMSTLDEELEELEREYKLTQVNHVYFDNELRTTFELPEDVSVSDEMVRAKRNELLDNEACEDASAKVLKAVASVICMVDALKNAGYKAEIAEDNCNDDVAIVLELLKENGENILFAS